MFGAMKDDKVLDTSKIEDMRKIGEKLEEISKRAIELYLKQEQEGVDGEFYG
jgi:hypothetical protein